MWTPIQPLPSLKNNKKHCTNNLLDDIRQSTQTWIVQQENMSPENSQKKYGTTSTSQLGTSYRPTQSDLSGIPNDMSQETGQKPQCSTSRLWSTLNDIKWKQNKSSPVDMKTQTNSRLWADLQLRSLKVSEPTWNQATRTSSSRLWKRLEDYPSSALLQAKKLNEKQKSLPSQHFASHNMQNTWRTNRLKMKTR